MLKSLKEFQLQKYRRKIYSFLMNKMIKKEKKREEKKGAIKRKSLIQKINNLNLLKFRNNRLNLKKYNLINQMMTEKIRKVTRKVKTKKINLQISKIIRLKSKKKSLIKVKKELKVMRKMNNNRKFKKGQKLNNLNNLKKERKVR
jgi:hypothetical protein